MLSFFRNYRFFFIAFFISLFVFGSMFASTTMLLLNQNQTVNHSASNVPIEDSYKPKPEDNLTLVWMGCQQDQDTPSFYYLLRFDVIDNTCTVIKVPPQTTATVNVATKTITEFYQYGGMRIAAQAVGNLFLLDNAYYYRSNFEETKKLFDFFTSLSFDFNEQVNTAEYSFPAGKQTLDGSRIASLFYDENFSQSSKLLSELLNQGLTDSLTNQLDSFYDLLFSIGATSLNRVLFNELDRPVHRFLRADSPKVSFKELSGEMDGEIYVPHATVLAELREQFAPPVASTKTLKATNSTMPISALYLPFRLIGAE